MPSTPTPWRRRLAAATALIHLLQLLLAGPAMAQVSGSPQAPSGQRPLVDAAANGVPVIHIAPPNPAGISRNGYERFNVPRQGMVLNNSPQAIQTQLAGWISHNLQLGRVPARIILNEVLGREPSQLLGVLEVAGQRADVVIANPNGITCDGCGFLNTAGRATLLGGRTQLDAQGGLASLEALASVRIGPRGLDAANQQQLDLVARGLVIEGEVWAQDLRAIIGANRVLYADLRGPLQELPAGPAGGGFAVDIGELGGMYAQQIYLVATERGLGVNSSGRLVALQGHLTLSSAGDLRVRDAHAQHDVQLSAQGRLDASGTLRAGGDLLLDAASVLGQGGKLEADGRIGIRAERIALDKQALAAAGRIDIEAGGELALTGGDLSTRETLRVTSGGAADLTGTRAWAVDAIALKSAGDLVTDRGQWMAPRLQLRAGAAYANRGGQLLARSLGPGDEETGTSLELHAASIDNTGGQLLAQDKLSLTATAGRLDNSEGTIAGGHVQLDGIEQLTNRGGTLYVDNALVLRALDNAGGLIDSTAALAVEAPGQTVDNRGGAIVARGLLALQAQQLDNTGGLLATWDDASLAITGAFDNKDGVLRANGHLDLQALRTDNHGGVIAGLQSVALAGGDLDNDAGVVEGGVDGLRIDLTGTLANTRSGSARGIASFGDVSVSAQRIDNQGGYIGASGRLEASAQDIDNRAGSLLGLEGASLRATGTVDNRQGLLASGADLALDAQALDNRAGTVFADGDLQVQASHVDNRQTLTDTKDRGLLAGGTLDLSISRLDNDAGLVAALGRVKLTASGGLGNQSGQVSGASVDVDTAQLSNSGGRIDAADALTVKAAVFSADGVLAAGGALGLHTEGDYTHTGTLSAGGDLDVSTTGHYVNAGTLSAQGVLHLAARDLANEEQGQIIGREVDIDVTGTVANAGLINATAGTTRIRAASLVNTGRIYGDSVVLQSDVRNMPNARGQGAVIAAREGLLKVEGNLRNEGGSLVLGLGDIAFGGEVTNIGATINAGGSIRFAKALKNLNGGLELDLSRADEFLSEVYITPIGATERYPLGELGWRNEMAGLRVLPSEEYPIGTFGAEWQPTAIDETCPLTGEDSQCNSGPRYGPDDPVWQRFAVAPPPPPPALPEGAGDCTAGGVIDSDPVHRDYGGACGDFWRATDSWQWARDQSYKQLQQAFDAFNQDLDRRSVNVWFEFEALKKHTETTVVIGSRPGQVLAGGDIRVNGGVNQDSLIAAGAGITGIAIDNQATQGIVRVTEEGRIRRSYSNHSGRGDGDHYYRLYDEWQPIAYGHETTFQLDTVIQRGNLPGSGPAPQPNTPLAPATPAQLVALRDKPLVLAAEPLPEDLARPLPTSLIAAPLRSAQGQVVQVLRTRFAAEAATQPLPRAAQANNAAPTRAAPLKGAGYVTVPYDGRIVAPASQLFGRSAPQAGYLVETDPAFTGWREFLSSAAMMAALAMDPERNLKRYADGFLEQRLIDEQVIALTGQRYLAGYESTEAEYAALIASGVAFAKAYRLTPGVALTARQMALLTTDIVWLVSEFVPLPDGNHVEALMPRVYLRRPAEGDLRPDGALIAASDIYLREPDGEIRNSGTLLAHGAGNEDGRGVLVLEAQDIVNSGALQGNAIFVDATRDLLLDGGTVKGMGTGSVARLYAARDIVLQTTTQTTFDTRVGPHGTTRVSGTNVDRIATVQADNVAMLADRDITLSGARVFATDSLGMKAARDIRLDTVQEAYTLDAPLGGEAFGRTGYYRASSQTHAGSEVSAGGNAVLDAGGDFTARGADLQAGGDMAVKGQSVFITGAIDQHRADVQGVGSGSYHRAATLDESLLEARIAADGNLTVTSAQDLTLRGASLSTQDGELKLDAAGDLIVGTLQLIHEQQTESRSESRGTFSSSRRQGETRERSTYSAGSTVSGNTVTLQAGTGTQGPGNLIIEGSQVVSEEDLTFSATGDVTLRAAIDTSESSAWQEQHESGPGAVDTFSWGTSQQKANSSQAQQTARGSAAGSLQGNVTITAGGTYRQVGSDLLALEGDIDVEARRIEVVEARETERSATHTETRDTALSISASHPLLEAAKTAGRMAAAAGNTSDPRLQALAAATTGLAMANAAGATQNPGPYGGASVDVRLGTSKSSNDSTSSSDQAAASSFYAKGRVRLKATGGGQDSDIVLQGVQLQAGADVSFEADDEVVMRAALNTREQHSHNKSSGASVGLNFGGGKDGAGFALTGSAQAARGQADGNDVTWTNTQIDVGGTFTLKTGGDTHMQGATVNANRIAAQIGGDLHIESLQDTSTYDSRQRNAGVNGSFGLVTRTSSGSASVGGSNVHSTYASVNEQSGLFARDGGFDVDVHGTTTLVGGAITTTDKAVAEGRNEFKTDRLVLQDIENKADYKASAYAVSVGNGQNNDGSRNAQGTSAGVGHDSGSASSVTRAGISGVAGDADARTGDPGTGIAPIFDADKVQREIDAQVAITSEFGQQGSKAWGNYANRQYLDALERGDSEAQDCWAPDGACRAGGHIAIGGLTGGVAGAVGAGVSSLTAPHLQEALVSAGVPLNVATHLAEAGVIAMAAGAGGAPGGAAALNEAGNNFIFAAGAIAEGIVAAGAAGARLCLANPSCVATVGMAGAAALDNIRRLAQSEPAPSGAPGYEPGMPRGAGPTTLPTIGRTEPSITASPSDAPGQAPLHTGGSLMAPNQNTSTVSPVDVGGRESTVVFNEAAGASETKTPIWSSTAKLSPEENAKAHWNKHKAEFPEFATAEQYVEGSHAFISNPPSGTLIKVIGGRIVMYHEASNTFAVRAADGAPRTMFRPDPVQHGYKTNLDYFHAQ